MVANENTPIVNGELVASVAKARIMPRDESLFPRALLQGLDWKSVDCLKHGVTADHPGHGLLVRPLQRGDFDRGFLQLMRGLTQVGDISKEEFNNRFELMSSAKGHYYITVIEDTEKGTIIGAATLFVEYKFIRQCAKRGRLEDVVVSEDYRGKQLGKLIVSTITLLARRLGCYKIGLDCRDAMKTFYSSLGYGSEVGNANTMVIRFSPTSTTTT